MSPVKLHVRKTCTKVVRHHLEHIPYGILLQILYWPYCGWFFHISHFLAIVESRSRRTIYFRYFYGHGEQKSVKAESKNESSIRYLSSIMKRIIIIEPDTRDYCNYEIKSRRWKKNLYVHHVLICFKKTVIANDEYEIYIIRFCISYPAKSITNVMLKTRYDT